LKTWQNLAQPLGLLAVATTLGGMNSNLQTVYKLGHLLRWLSFVGSVTLMLIIAIAAGASFAQLRISDFWQEHTREVLATAQTLLTDLLNIQGNARDYVLTGQPSALKRA